MFEIRVDIKKLALCRLRFKVLLDVINQQATFYIEIKQYSSKLHRFKKFKA